MTETEKIQEKRNWDLSLSKADKIVLLLCVIHLITWSIIPFVLRINIPMDSIEASGWGRNITWGYDKNPYWNPWIARAFMEFFRYSDYGIYFGSQFSIITMFISMWVIARDCLKPFQAIIAVFIIECSIFVSSASIEFNDNNLSVGYWALTVAFFYFAVTREKLIYWLLIGIAGGMAIMTKYSAIFLFAAMFFYLLSGKETRKFFKTPKPYLTAVVTGLFILPHFMWLMDHDFITVKYVQHRTHLNPSNWNHLLYPASFLGEQLGMYVPCAILMLLGSCGFKPMKFKELFHDPKARLTIFMALGPILLICLNSGFSGSKLRTMWGQPISIFWGLFLVYWLQPKVNLKSAKRFFIFLAIVFIGIATAYTVCYIIPDDDSSAHYPGKAIAEHITGEWHKQYDKPIAFAAGHREMTYLLSHYSEDHPKSYVYRKIFREKEKFWNNAQNPSFSEEDLKAGTVVIWDPQNDYTNIYATVKKHFPNAGKVKLIKKPRARFKKKKMEAAKYVFIPPAEKPENIK